MKFIGWFARGVWVLPATLRKIYRLYRNDPEFLARLNILIQCWRYQHRKGVHVKLKGEEHTLGWDVVRQKPRWDEVGGRFLLNEPSVQKIAAPDDFAIITDCTTATGYE